MNVAAIVAGIVLLTGIFSIYTFLLKKDRSFLAEESSNRTELQFEEEVIPSSQAGKGVYDTGSNITETEKPEIKNPSKPLPDKKQVKALQKKDSEDAISKEKTIADEEIMDALGVSLPELTIAINESDADIQAAPMAKTSEVEPPQFNSKGLSSRVKKKSEITISRQAASIKSDSLILPEFVSDKYTGFNDYILKNLKKLYPELKISDKEEIEVSFLVTRDGKVRNIQILRGPGSEIDRAIMQLIKNSPNWFPATQNGQKTDYQLLFTVILQEDILN
jgi:TonB family protein